MAHFFLFFIFLLSVEFSLERYEPPYSEFYGLNGTSIVLSTRA